MVKEATFGAGCFWCIEACYKEVNGVISVTPGYTGGQTENPTYEEVCSGNTGHAEVARIVFDDELISYEELLELFWFLHDPTQLNRQGGDIGTQYRSVIYYHDDLQKAISEKYKNKLQLEKVWENPIVTEISPISKFYSAEEYHKDYFNRNPQNQYCTFVVKPKVEKFKSVFSQRLKN
jgi:peptide-methionine (S)-S-oxide reductase